MTLRPRRANGLRRVAAVVPGLALLLCSQSPGLACDTYWNHADGTFGAITWLHNWESVSALYTTPSDCAVAITHASFAGETLAGGEVVVSVHQGDLVRSETVYVDWPGGISIEFSNPLCVGPDTDFVVSICKPQNSQATVGIFNEQEGPGSGRSYVSHDCSNPLGTAALFDHRMSAGGIECFPVSVDPASWGFLKAWYR